MIHRKSKLLSSPRCSVFIVHVEKCREKIKRIKPLSTIIICIRFSTNFYTLYNYSLYIHIVQYECTLKVYWYRFGYVNKYFPTQSNICQTLNNRYDYYYYHTYFSLPDRIGCVNRFNVVWARFFCLRFQMKKQCDRAKKQWRLRKTCKIYFFFVGFHLQIEIVNATRNAITVKSLRNAHVSHFLSSHRIMWQKNRIDDSI